MYVVHNDFSSGSGESHKKKCLLRFQWVAQSGKKAHLSYKTLIS